MRTREVRRDRVVVGFDGSDAAVRALARAADEIEPGGTLTIVSVQADVRSSGALSEDLLDSTTAAVDIVEEARLSLGVRDDITVETVPGTGEPATVILDVARKSRADLIVVGRRGRDFAARVLLGSVAARVVEQAPCDVLIVA